MRFTTPGTYSTRVILQGYTTPIFNVAKLSGHTYSANVALVITKTQENTVGMEWGLLTNGDWVILVKNGKDQVAFVSAGTTPPPVVIPPVDLSKHTIKVDAIGRISIDGLPYE